MCQSLEPASIGQHVRMLPDQALQQVVEGCGAAFRPCVTPDLRALLLRTLLHPNRFARETAYHTLAGLFGLCQGPQLLEWGEEAAERLQDGLSENWSQVRMSGLWCSCRACPAFWYGNSYRAKLQQIKRHRGVADSSHNCEQERGRLAAPTHVPLKSL